MGLVNFADIWSYLGPFVGALLGFFSSYLLERRRERLQKDQIIQIVECVELVNSKILDEETVGPLRGDIQIKVPRAGPGSEIIDVKEIYFARYRLRNLSDRPIERLLVSKRNGPKSTWFTIHEGESKRSPDWSKLQAKVTEEEHVSEQRGWATFPIAYLNPYKSTGHEIFIDMSSYLPFDKMEIEGSAKGINFVFKKLSEAT
jgi:hypothetical protein